MHNWFSRKAMGAPSPCTGNDQENVAVSISDCGAQDLGKAVNGLEPSVSKQSSRLLYVDWIRAFIIALVVAFHTIDLYFDYTYSTAVYLGIVSDAQGGYARQVAIVIAQLMQSWFMGLMFLLSGYFSTPSYDRKGALRFLMDRALRLLLPLLVYDCFIQPLAFEVARHSPSAPAALQAAPDGFTYYYSTQFVRIGHGVSWYLVVLLIFDLLYVAARVCMDGCSRGVAAAGGSWQAAATSCGTGTTHQQCEGVTHLAMGALAAGQPKNLPQLPVSVPYEPAKAPLQQRSSGQHPVQSAFSRPATAIGVVGVAALIAGLCLLVRAGILLPLGLQQSMWVVQAIQFQPEYLPQYAVAFVLGLAAYQVGSSLQRLPCSAGPVAAVAAAVLAVGGAVIMTYFPGSNFGVELQQEASLPYVAVYTVWEQFYAVTMWLAVLVCFRRWLNKEGGKAGAAVSGAAYAVYLIHVPVLTAFGLAFAPVAWPAAAKCLVVTPLVVVSSCLVGVLLRLVPGVKRVL